MLTSAWWIGELQPGSHNEKVVFADNANKYDRRSRKQRRVVLISEHAMYIIAIEKNKDKDKIARKKKPWVYVLKRRIEIKKINSVMLSTHADNFVMFIVPGEHDNLLECRRKTELVGAIKKANPSLTSTITDSYEYSASLPLCLSASLPLCLSASLRAAFLTLLGVSSFPLTIKGGKKRALTVGADPSAGLGKLKGKKICAPSGLAAGTKPNLPEPKVMEDRKSTRLNSSH